MNSTTVRVNFFATFVLLLLFAIPVMAEQASITIKPGTLEDALDAYSKATGTKTVYLNELIEGKNSPGAQTASPGDALQQILQGTGLTFQMADNSTAVLKKKKSMEKQPIAKQQRRKTGESELQHAHMEMEIVTVSANKMEEDLQNVPQSITVIDDEVLKEKGIVDIPDVINEIPNMTFSSGIDDNVNFRGLNKSLFTNNNPVVIYIDGVAYSSSYGFDASLVNVERIEVLRGPQGTLYGKDAIGAVIKIVTKEPENEWHGNIGTEYGSYNDIQGSFNVNGSLIQDKLYLGLNGRYHQDDGWITNDYTDDDQANKSNNHNLGAFLLYKPTDRLSAKFTLSNDYSEHNGYTGYALPGGTSAGEFDRDDAEHVSFDEETVYETESLAQSLHLKYEFDSLTFSSTTTHRDLCFDGVWDKDYMADTAMDGLFSFGYTDTETWTEELRLSSNNTEGVRWVAGAYFDSEDMETRPTGIQVKRFGSVYEMKWESETESKTLAMFGQIMIPLGNNFELTLGARYQQIDKKMDLDAYYNLVGIRIDPYYSLHADETWTSFLPKAALSYQLNDNWTTYASMAQGYMPGGFTTLAASGSQEDNTFDPQQSTNYEIGIKGKLNRARFTAAVFYMDIEDTQYSKYVNDTWVTDNAGSSHSLGAELELTYFLTDSIELTAALGIIEAEYDDYDDGTVVWDGESIQNTPSYSARVGAAYYHPNGFYARGDVRGQGEVPYYDSVNEEFREINDYITADVKVGYRFKGIDIYAYCNNLTDEEYMTYFVSGSAKSLATYGDPRTFGIGVRYSF
nr:TonB-dependent receptor [uncultured Desulfobacter sp.]